MANIARAVDTAGKVMNIFHGIDQNERLKEQAKQNTERHNLAMEEGRYKLDSAKKLNDQQSQLNEQSIEAKDYDINLKKKLEHREDARLFLSARAQAWDKGDPMTPEDVQAVFDATGLDPVTFTQPEYAKNFRVFDGVMKGKVKANSPEALDAANALWRERVMQGNNVTKDGKKITDKRIVNVVMSPDNKNVMFDLEVTTEDGKKYKSPVTEKRSADPENDPFVKQIPVEGLMKDVSAQSLLFNALSQKDLKNSVDGYLTALNSGKRTSGLSLADRAALEEYKAKLKGANDMASDGRDRARQIELEANKASSKELESEGVKTRSKELVFAENRIARGIGTPQDQAVIDDWKQREQVKSQTQAIQSAQSDAEPFWSGLPSTDYQEDPSKIYSEANKSLLSTGGKAMSQEQFNNIYSNINPDRKGVSPSANRSGDQEGGGNIRHSSDQPRPTVGSGSTAESSNKTDAGTKSDGNFNEDEYLKSLGF